jgi:hypothetical protein
MPAACARDRAAYMAGAEEHSRATFGRGLTDDGLAGVLLRFPRASTAIDAAPCLGLLPH